METGDQTGQAADRVGAGDFGNVPVIGLPGNPTSALVTFGLLARPYLLRIQGVEEAWRC